MKLVANLRKEGSKTSPSQQAYFLWSAEGKQEPSSSFLGSKLFEIRRQDPPLPCASDPPLKKRPRRSAQQTLPLQRLHTYEQHKQTTGFIRNRSPEPTANKSPLSFPPQSPVHILRRTALNVQFSALRFQKHAHPPHHHLRKLTSFASPSLQKTHISRPCRSARWIALLFASHLAWLLFTSKALKVTPHTPNEMELLLPGSLQTTMAA